MLHSLTLHSVPLMLHSLKLHSVPLMLHGLTLHSVPLMLHTLTLHSVPLMLHTQCSCTSEMPHMEIPSYTTAHQTNQLQVLVQRMSKVATLHIAVEQCITRAG
jgi:hypothetical protein